MVLNDEQNELFFDTMDSLLYYVNDRFRVVEGFTLNYSSPLDDVKSSLVSRTLWENVEIIDDFIAINPYRLPSRCLELAKSWKSALPGFYTLVRYQSGRALLMSEAGVFSVCGVTYELEQEIGPAPAYVDTVLLPFGDMIVYDGFLQAYDTERTSAEVQRIQDEFENRCAKGIAVTGADFIRQADAFLADQRDKELEALLADVSGQANRSAEVLPEGFHRGALAGLSIGERRQAVERHFAEHATPISVAAKTFDKRVRKREPITDLKQCLSLLTKAELEVVAQVLGMGGLSRMRKAEMVDELAEELPNSPDAFESRLLIVGDRDFEMARVLAETGKVVFGLGDRNRYAFVWPIEPYTFLFRGVSSYTFVVPEELRRMMAGVDFDAIGRVRRQQKQAISCIDACVTMCGVAAVDDVYDQYRALVSDVLSREEFDQLIEAATYFGDAAFDVWTYVPTDYLVHYTLTPDFVAQEFARSQRVVLDAFMRHTETGEISSAPFRRMVGQVRDNLAAELEKLEQYKRDLVESQSNMPMKPLSRTLLENDVMGELLDDENAVRLRAFLDERIPDGEDDYSFADRVVEEMVLTAIESGTLQGMYAVAGDFGIEGCTADEQRFALLITNLYNAMPSWENNGWSPQELYEQLTGRKMFYNDDGTVMKLGADDPCPCGSGKKYRDCCGR